MNNVVESAKCATNCLFEWATFGPYKEPRYCGDSASVSVSPPETHICLTRYRMCLWEKGLTALQTQSAEIRYSPAATDTMHTLTQESLTHTLISLAASFLLSWSHTLHQAQVECLCLDTGIFLYLLTALTILPTLTKHGQNKTSQTLCDIMFRI